MNDAMWDAAHNIYGITDGPDYLTAHLPDGWDTARCCRCSGFGQIWIGLDGGPGECPACNSGVVFVTPKGKHVLYPGGPFCAG